MTFQQPHPPATESQPSPPVPALSLRGLAKRFGGKIAVDGISLDVPAGSFFGIVGPNGAGKTTTLSMATGLLRPDFGTALVHGVDVWAQPLEAKKLMGILPGRRPALRPAHRRAAGHLRRAAARHGQGRGGRPRGGAARRPGPEP